MDGAFVIGRRPFWPTALAVGSFVLSMGFLAATFLVGPWWLGAIAGAYFALGAIHAMALLDKTPLFVADEHGVRMPVGGSWIGLLWRELGEVRVENRHGLLQDPQVKVVTTDAQRVYTAPLGMATNTKPEVALAELARRREPASY